MRRHNRNFLAPCAPSGGAVICTALRGLPRCPRLEHALLPVGVDSSSSRSSAADAAERKRTNRAVAAVSAFLNATLMKSTMWWSADPKRRDRPCWVARSGARRNTRRSTRSLLTKTERLLLRLVLVLLRRCFDVGVFSGCSGRRSTRAGLALPYYGAPRARRGGDVHPAPRGGLPHGGARAGRQRVCTDDVAVAGSPG